MTEEARDVPAPAPVRGSERIETLDVLRGFALLGILTMNVRAMAAPFGAYFYPHALFDYAGASRAAYAFTSVFFDLKMMGLFSMLFGAGALLYARKAAPGEPPPTALWLRRMFWLLAIGLVHAYLIWDGDILVPYALCGLLVLWWVRGLPAPALAGIALVFLALGALISLGHGLAWEMMPEADRAREAELWMPTREQAQDQLGRMLGSYTGVVAWRASFVFEAQTFVFAAFFLWRCGGMMLLGMALYKWGFLDGRLAARHYTWTAAVCLPVGLLLAARGVAALEAVRFAMPERTVADLWNYFGAAIASVGYAALCIRLVQARALGAVRRALAAVGRTALSNYLLQSVLGALVFLGAGFGLAGRLGYAGQLGYVAAVWVLQLAASRWWLTRFRSGPVEWLWRSLTYRRVQPLRHPGAAGELPA